METYSEAIIVGGGLAGLAAAIALRERVSQKITILEASSESDFADRSAGAAVQLTDNGLRALELLSPTLHERVLQHAAAVTGNFLVWPSRESVYDNVTAAAPSQRTLMIPWGVLRHLLWQAAEPYCEIRFQTVVEGVQDGCRLRTTTAGGVVQETTVPAGALLVVANGSHSIFRPTPVQYQPRVNVKAVVEFHDNMPLDPTASTYCFFGNPKAACFVGPAGPPNHFYWAISLAVDDSRTADISVADVTAALSAPEAGFWHQLVAATPADRVFRQRSVQADIPAEMVQTGDGTATIVLVGDAAHCMSSSYGQAACLAMEDAATLRHRPLAEYTALRRQRCLDLQRVSQQRASQAMKHSTTNTTNNNHDSNNNTTSTTAPTSTEDWMLRWDLPAKPSPDSSGGYAVVG